MVPFWTATRRDGSHFVHCGVSPHSGTYSTLRSSFPVSFQGIIDLFRANQMIQDKAQFVDNGASLLRTVTLYWIIWLAPVGRIGKRSFAVLRLLGRTGHSLQGAPCTQPLPDSLNTPILPWKGTPLDKMISRRSELSSISRS